MSLESYVLRLQQEPHPRGADWLAQKGLSVLERLYIRGVENRRKKECAQAVQTGIPVISVGNITAGGTGKTPCIMTLAEMLQKMGRHPAVLTRGYKGGLEKTGGLVSDRERILVSPQKAGDEPYMLACKLPGVPVIAGRDRVVSAAAAKALGADVLLLDDGFQYWRLARDLDLVLIDCTEPFGGQRVLPRGLLREPMTSLSRAGLFLLTKADQVPAERRQEIRESLAAYAPGVPVAESAHVPQSFTPLARWPVLSRFLPEQGTKAFLLSGIGNPEAFRKTAEAAGLAAAGSMQLPDHHRYTGKEIEQAVRQASQVCADCIVVTEKDAVKLKETLEPAECRGMPIYVLGIEMRLPADGEAVFQELLDQVCRTVI